MYTVEYYSMLSDIENIYWNRQMMTQWFAIRNEIFICEIALGMK